MQDFVAKMTDDMVLELKKQYEKDGIEFSKNEEMYYRLGISSGFTIASQMLNRIPVATTVQGLLQNEET